MKTKLKYLLNSRKGKSNLAANPVIFNRTQFFINIFALCTLLTGFAGCLKEIDKIPVNKEIVTPFIPESKLTKTEDKTIVENDGNCIESIPSVNKSDSLASEEKNTIVTFVQWTN